MRVISRYLMVSSFPENFGITFVLFLFDKSIITHDKGKP
jgi:hypothetical protein